MTDTSTPETPLVEEGEFTFAPPLWATFSDALAGFQQGLPTVAKNRTADVRGREGKASYKYDYADLTDVSEVALPLLAANGLSWHCGLDMRDDGSIVIRWELMHGASGEGRTGTLPVGRSGADWQSMGSAITYARRYALCAATGIAPGGDDDDAQAATAGSAQRQAPARQAPVATTREYLPEGLYDLSTLTDKTSTLAMYRQARGAGHLPLIIGVEEQGEMVEQEFGQWLIALGKSFPLTPEEIEAAAVAAHEAEQAATVETAQAPVADEDAPEGDR
jgi:hypothetical protein